MKILFALTYYRPHVSGLTIYVQRLAEALAARGHQVTVLTSHYDQALPLEETIHGVRVVRVPVAFRVSKGAIMPSYPAVAMRLLREHDVVAANLPNTPIEALLLPLMVRFLVRRPVTMTYHCDVQLPAGFFNHLVDEVVFLSNVAAATLADRLVAYTQDYATHSRLLRRFPGKRVVIPPPVDMPAPTADQVEAFRHRFDLCGKRVVGFVARFATEKGVEYALHAIPRIVEELPNVKILFAGEYKKVIGEEAYWARLQPLLQRYANHWQFTGVLDPTDPAELASFYAACDVTILPSINMTESFGLVQVESMLCGTPVVASNLPGVRQPVTVTQMGRIVPIKDSAALAQAIVEVIRHRDEYRHPRAAISRTYSIGRTADEYEQLFTGLMAQPSRRERGALGLRGKAMLALTLLVMLVAAFLPPKRVE
ncbi:MAG: glycosyltransferase family 4 protein [Ardenticatenaceae bacterium]|nr:glycosyltransferase family 4 protein [Ardenticatenaceae bacterium]HBY95606.1 glycosyltransferase family 1 protein [Chloroflexota bacterium]